MTERTDHWLAPLLGHWDFRYMEQRIYLASGELREVIRQEAPQSNCRALVVTEQTLTTHFDYTNGSPTGAPGYSTTRTYTRSGNTLWVEPVAGIDPLPTTILLLTDNQLLLRAAPTPSLGFTYEWEQYFSR